jgi:hypothetical protein
LIKKYITIKKIHRFDFKNKIKNYYYYYNQIHNICIWMITNSISFASGMMFTDLPWEILIQKTDLKLNMKLHFLCQHICVVSDPLRERERERELTDMKLSVLKNKFMKVGIDRVISSPVHIYHLLKLLSADK